MSWITKPSATTTIPRRDEPYLTSAMREELTSKILPRYATKQGGTLSALHMIQEAYHWIPPQALEEVAQFLSLTPAEVLDTASFYEEYWLKPRGTHVIAVCRSIACEFCNHKAITDACKAKLGIELGETTDDGKFTLVELECLGSCGSAPVALIDHTLHENLTPDQMPRLIDDAERSGGHH
ncbi:MAG: NAD(P)H-dependent oxidoreductase subunit E [Phycisphaerales bacterium]